MLFKLAQSGFDQIHERVGLGLKLGEARLEGFRRLYRILEVLLDYIDVHCVDVGLGRVLRFGVFHFLQVCALHTAHG